MPLLNQCLRLCLVSNLKQRSFPEYKKFLHAAINGGVTSIQLREKKKDLAEFHQLAIEFKSFLRPYNIPLIINDHVEIAKAIDAEGVHIGQTDISPAEARRILGPNKIIGWSVESFKELEISNDLSCIDYIAASAVFQSKTKPDIKTLWGLDGLETIARRSRHPVMAIGGITQRNIEEVIQAGACGVAVIGAIHDYDDPKLAAAELINGINVNLEGRELCYRK